MVVDETLKGASEGFLEGLRKGWVDGVSVTTDGNALGTPEGRVVGTDEGKSEDSSTVGTCDVTGVGSDEGSILGSDEGKRDATVVGVDDGVSVGRLVGGVVEIAALGDMVVDPLIDGSKLKDFVGAELATGEADCAITFARFRVNTRTCNLNMINLHAFIKKCRVR